MYWLKRLGVELARGVEIEDLLKYVKCKTHKASNKITITERIS